MELRDPIFRITARSVFTFLALLIVALLLYVSTGYPPRARYVPQVIAVFALLCLLLQLILDSFPKLSKVYKKVEREDVFQLDETDSERKAASRPELTLEVTTYMWLAALLAGLYVLGFLVTIPLYVLFYLRFQAQLTWVRSALYGIGTFLFIYLLFSVLFGVYLYPGILIDTFTDL